MPGGADLVDETDGRRVILGAGRRRDLAAELDRVGAGAVLVIGGRHSGPVVDELVPTLSGRDVRRITGVTQHVPGAEVDTALALVDEGAVEAVVTIGGGSVIGLGKAVALARPVVLMAVPTTYSGSEMTPIWGITDGSTKRTGRDERVRPSVVIYDPELTVGLSRRVSAASAFNALAHGVEALWAPDRTDATTARADEAIGVIVEAVRAVSADPAHVAARGRLLYGAYRAGQVIGAVSTALHHRTSHVLGGRFGLDHGGMNAALLPHVVAYNLGWGSWDASPLERALGADPAARLSDLARETGAPSSLAELGMAEDGIDSVLDEIIERVSDANPRRPDRDSLRELLARAWRGDPPSPFPPRG